MKVNLLDNQIDIILKSLENYIVTTPEKRHLFMQLMKVYYRRKSIISMLANVTKM